MRGHNIMFLCRTNKNYPYLSSNTPSYLELCGIFNRDSPEEEEEEHSDTLDIKPPQVQVKKKEKHKRKHKEERKKEKLERRVERARERERDVRDRGYERQERPRPSKYPEIPKIGTPIKLL